MAEFFDNEAVESDNEHEEEDEQVSRPTKKKKRRIATEDDDEDDEEEDENKIREEMEGFVVSGDEEEEENEGEKSDEEKSGEDSGDELSDEDMAVVRENLGIPEKARTKNRVFIEDDEEEPEDDRERIGQQLFGAEDDETEERAPSVVAGSERPVEEPEEVSESGESDADDFIERDDEQPRRRPKHRGERRLPVSEAALEEARDIFGVDFELDQLEEEEDIQEDGEYPEEEAEEYEEGSRVSRRVRKRALKESLLEHIEPSEIERGFLSECDNRIMLEDKPERFQLRRVPLTEAETDEIQAEADWIYRSAFCTVTITMQDETMDQSASKPPEPTVRKIVEALKFMRNQHFEVPFIAFYRKEYVEPELGINDLWKIYQWDEKWCQLQQRKRRLIDLMERMQKYQYDILVQDPEAALPEDVRLISEDDITAVWEVENVDDLGDILAQFHLYYGVDLTKLAAWEKNRATSEETELQDTRFKQASRKDAYSICVNAGLSGLAAKFGLTPRQYGENLKEQYMLHEVDQYPVDPMLTSEDYRGRQFQTAERVLEGAMYMVARQFSREPLVRKYLREQYRYRAVICLRPTKKGRKEIDENHPIYTRKYLKNQPVRDLAKDEFLRLYQAEDNGLIQMTISPDEKATEIHNLTMLESLLQTNQFFRKDEFSELVQKWNKLRDEVLTMCLQKFLYPLFAKELRAKLLQESRDFVIRECCLKLYGWLKIGPYTVDHADENEENDALHGVRVLGIAYASERDQASFCALIDGDGEMNDHLRLAHLTKRKNSTRRDDARLKEQDLDSLKKFILRRKPHVIALSGENLDAIFIKTDIEMALNELSDQGELNRRIEVEIVDNELAKVYMNSKRAMSEFPSEFPMLLRQAVSLARRLQDPLPEFCQMCTPDEEILCLSYHPLQDQVNKDDLLSALILEFINRVNEVGVDINRGLEHPHTFPMLQFVCGLGPRKSAQLLKILKQNDNLLENRTKLVTLCRMGPKVFMNCAGFIKIDTAKVSEKTDAYVEVLDGSRVHPETYEWARKMAVDALEYDDSAEDANPASALEEILESPERLKDLDLDAFAEELQRQQFGNKSITLYDIRAELNHRYKDLRQAYRSPTKEELFNLLTKESPQTFNVGKLVMGRVMHVMYRKPKAQQMEEMNPVRDDSSGFWSCPLCLKPDFSELSEVWKHFDMNQCPGQAIGVKVRLENGISGFIPTKYISDSQVDNPADRVLPNMPVYCRVLKVDTDRFQAELSCRSSDLADRDCQFRPPKDRYYDEFAEHADTEEEKAKKVAAERCQYVKRVIAHPVFHNITFKDAERMLANADQGECIIRPSSKGADHLTATWKVTTGIYQHIDIQEEKKEKPFSLGKSLKIDNEEFEDLDEIIARHIQPLASHARDIINYKNYHDGPVYDENEQKTEKSWRVREHIEEHLHEMKNESQARIPYILTPSPQLQGKFMLSYLPRMKARHEFVTVTPDGFRFRQQIFPTLSHLFRWFKEHFRDAIPGTTPSHRGTPRSQYGNAAPVTPGMPFDNISRMSAVPPHPWPAPGFMPPPFPGMPAPGQNWVNPETFNMPSAPAPARRTPAAGNDWADAARNWAQSGSGQRAGRGRSSRN